MSLDVLIVEDTPSLQSYYAAILRREGWDVSSATTAADARRLIGQLEPRVVALDLGLPDDDGVDVMRDALAHYPKTRFIIITADTSVHRAVEAMQAGAGEFLVKPFDDERLIGAVRVALAGPALPPAQPGPQDDTLRDFIGSSAAMTEVYATIAACSRSLATVFITGESGTGKDLCAQAIHRSSDRAKGPFVPLGAGAVAPEILDSELFGHVRGAFPGAVTDKPGAAALAHGGTLFLGEVCELPPPLQTKLLRFVQTSTIHPIGASQPQKVDVRIVCATSRDPLEMVRQGLFREDLYYRLHVVPIHLPPLRDRGEDVIEIATVLLRRFAAEEGRSCSGLTEGTRTILRRYGWPGNVRQLSNAIWNAVIMNDGPMVTPEMLPPEVLGREPVGAKPGEAGAAPSLGELTDGMTLAEVEREVIESAIARFGGSVPRAARALDVAPSTIYRKRESWGRHER